MRFVEVSSSSGRQSRNLISKMSPEGQALDPSCRADPVCRSAAYAAYTKATIMTPLGMSDTGLIDFKSGDLWPITFPQSRFVSPPDATQATSKG